MIDQALECGLLRVVFHWRSDRYGHTIERRIGGQWQRVLESVEGSPEEDWPPSPVLQSLQIEHREGGPVALLVGQAGKSHWSASAEALPQLNSVQFDIACRVQQPPQHLGSAYRSTAAPAKTLIDISVIPDEAACELSADDETNVWRIRPLEVLRDSPATLRWRYTIGLGEIVQDQAAERVSGLGSE